MAVFLAWFWFGGVSMASTVDCTTWDPAVQNENAVAKIWENCYDSLEDAIAGANDGDVVYLLKDYIISEAIQINDKSLTIEWSWDLKAIWFEQVADIWNSNTAYVFKIWINSASSDINVKLKNLIIKNSFYWIKHGYSNSSKKTILTLHDVSFENLTYWAVDMQNELSELHNEWSVEIEDGDLFVNIDTYDWNKNYVIPEWYDYCYINLNKYTCFNNENSLLGMKDDVIAKIWTKYFSNLANAIDASSVLWDEVLLLKDYSLNDQLQIKSWDNVIIDLNWKKLDVAAGYSNSIYHSCPVMVNYWGSLILKSSVDWWSISTMVDSLIDSNVYWAVCVTRKSTDPNDWLAKLTIESWSYSWYYYWIVWNGSRHGTEININWWIIEWINWSAIYHPQDWVLNIEWWDLIWEDTAIELRAWKLTISWWTFTAKAEPTSSEANWNWTTTRGAAIAIAQHDTKKEISVNIDWWVFNWISAVYQSNPQNNNISSDGVWSVTTVLKDWSFNWQIWNKDDANNKLVIQWWNYKDINWDTYKTENLSNYIDEWKSANAVDEQWNVLYVIEKKIWDQNVKSYLIKLESVSNWNISSTPSDKAHSWDKVTLTATPNSNYNFSKWTVKSWNVEIKVENNQFTMPAANVTVSATFTAKPVSYSWGGGGSSRSSSRSSSNNTMNEVVLWWEVEVATGDKTEVNTGDENKVDETKSEENTAPQAPTATDVEKYGQELVDAYIWARNNGITTMPTIEQARLKDWITRAELSKMMVVFMSEVLKKQPVLSGNADYADVDNSLGDLADYIQKAYQYQIMWINADWTPIKNFNPNGKVSRAEFATVLSRVLFGSKYNQDGANYYEWHIKALAESKILTNTDPKIQELRWWIILMLYRSQNSETNNEEENTAQVITWDVAEVESGSAAEVTTWTTAEIDTGAVVEAATGATAETAIAEANTWDVAKVESGSTAEVATWDSK